MTYNASDPPAQSKTQTLSMLMNQSLIMLPKEKMKPRYYDERVGWFSVGQIDYSSDALKSDQKRLIRRWKLVPKDIEAYKRGELVEPVKPIVYYLDPATPMKFRSYMKEGIELWQKAFEAAGEFITWMRWKGEVGVYGCRVGADYARRLEAMPA